MPIGVFIETAAVILGSLAGSALGSKLSEDIKQHMNWIFGICSLGMGISSVVLMKNMPVVVFSTIAGTMIGLVLKIGVLIHKAADNVLSRFMKNTDKDQAELMLTATVLFCAGATGIYGALDAGMTGNHSILVAKAVLDIFTAMIFACQLGKVVALISIPQFAILTVLFLLAKVILPMASDSMIQDFKACGGFILLATGFRMMQLKAFPIADMIPAMIIVMPISYWWSTWILPFVS